MTEVERLMARKDSHVRVEKDEIVLSPLEAAPRPASAEALAACITERLPRVELSEVLMEVDTWTRFPGILCMRLMPPASDPLCCPISMPVSWRMRAISALKWRLTDIAADHLAWCTTLFLARTPEGRLHRVGQLSLSPPVKPGLGQWHAVLVRWAALPRRARRGMPDGPRHGLWHGRDVL